MTDTNVSEQPTRAHTFAHLLLDTAQTLSHGNKRRIQRFHRDHGFTHMLRHLDYLLDALWLSTDVHRLAQARDSEASRAVEYAEVLVTVTRFLARAAAQPDGIGPQMLHAELITLQLYLLRLLRETGGFEDLLERYDIDHEECLAELRGVPAYRS